ncbi:unnamed protein product [Owenia fusiformis]|uniref:Uncharacterized protein n=1 Tax=Owenia fusiformis TaxID=6347 RepID=A0A8J1XXY5_OWEFU|nr:unnamed protein product [Owenia fusiformis]
MITDIQIQLSVFLLFTVTSTYANSAQDALTALAYVQRVETENCTGGTNEVLPVQFSQDVWSEYANVAVRTANLLSKSLTLNGGTFSADKESFLFDVVRNNVAGNTLIFGSAIAVEDWVYTPYQTFCPYSYKDEFVHAFDLSLSYDYMDNGTEWYHTLRVKDWSNSPLTKDKVKYRLNSTHHAIEIDFVQPTVDIADGHWTYPYYDCGGGNIWMVTYSSPILMVDSSPPGNVIFKGIATIDIELTNIDINQCDPEEFTPEYVDEGADDIFRGTHSCRESTKCVPVSGLGLTRGAYDCYCKDGYYFPHSSVTKKAFEGLMVELSINTNDTSLDFECIRCAEGCDTCVDDSPCLYYHNIAIRLVVLVLVLVMLVLIALTAILIRVYREYRAIRSGSPMFLYIMCLGATLLCLSMFIAYPEPTGILCIIKPWPHLMGFTFAYGALLLKTWRVSAIFRVKSAKRVNLTDKVLAQRLIPIVGVTTVFLVVWSVAGTPTVMERRTDTTDLKWKDCDDGLWKYGALGGKAVLLLWGAYLCHVVRKAPSNFNESKYITWAIYNNVILDSFMIIIKQLIVVKQGPDLVYLMQFIQLQISVTFMMCLIFIPKFAALKHAMNYPEQEKSLSTQGASQATSTVGVLQISNKDVAVQTQEEPSVA